MRYEWANGFTPKVNADDVGAELERLRQEAGGELYPETVVAAAQDPRSPLHSLFEWNDVDAADRYRITQARGIIRRLRVVQQGTKEQPRVVRLAFVSPGQVKHPGYIPTDEAVADPVKRDQLVANAVAALEGWIARYKSMDLEELESVTRELEVQVKRLKRRQRSA